jgi:hypothetical protein
LSEVYATSSLRLTINPRAFINIKGVIPQQIIFLVAGK